MTVTSNILWIYFIAVNTLAFSVYGIDKSRARRNLWRIPEWQLMAAALIGGTPGAYLGMKIFHHKTRKPKFRIGIPVIFIIQVLAVLYVVKR